MEKVNQNTESVLSLDLRALPQQKAIQCWLIAKGITKRELAAACSCGETFVTRVMLGSKKSKRVRNNLIEFGIPAELLPRYN